MARTKDRFPGKREEEATCYDSTVLATQLGEVRFDGTRFSMFDNLGEFDPRDASGAVFSCSSMVLSSDYTVPTNVCCRSCNLCIEDGATLTIDDGGVMET